MRDFLIETMGLPIVASEQGKQVDYFLVYIHWLMLILFIGWGGYFIVTLIKFRASKNPKANYHGVQNHASTWLELAVAAIEVVLLIGFAIPLWAKVVEKGVPDENDPDVTVIRVTAEQFLWNSRYAGQDGVFGKRDYKLVSQDNKFGYDPADAHGRDDIVPPQNVVHAPLGKPVIIHLTSLDVIHGFALHSMRVQQDCIPGLSVPVHFVAKETGTFAITCAQLCGSGHYRMRANLTVDTEEDFNNWILENTPIIEDTPAAGGAAPAADAFE
jgi:cytochrome c oxidase subunit 2